MRDNTQNEKEISARLSKILRHHYLDYENHGSDTSVFDKLDLLEKHI